MRGMLMLVAALLAAMLALPTGAAVAAPEVAETAPDHGGFATDIDLPEARLIDQDGNAFAFNEEALGDRVVLVGFVFTSCSSICPALTAVMAAARKRLPPDVARQALVLSVTVDPLTDTPERLRVFAEQAGADAGWRWLTGEGAEVNRVLRAFGVVAGRPEDHPPLLVVGHPKSQRWMRWVGVPTPASLVDAMASMRSDAALVRARDYFGDEVLVDQDGRSHRFVSDLLADRRVLINVFFTTCEGACPLMTQRLKVVRRGLGDRFGREVWFLSLSVDPTRDTPAMLKRFAAAQSADEPGWRFLSADAATMRSVLGRLGQWTERPDDHSTLLIAGDARRSHWVKLRPDASPEQILAGLQRLE